MHAIARAIQTHSGDTLVALHEIETLSAQQRAHAVRKRGIAPEAAHMEGIDAQQRRRAAGGTLTG